MSCGPATRSSTSGTCWRRSGSGRPTAEDNATEMACSPRRQAAVLTRLRAAGVDPAQHAVVVVHVSAGNPFRRWPRRGLRRARHEPGSSGFAAAGAAGVGPVGGDGGAGDRRDRARAELGPLASSVVNGVELDLAELRAALDRRRPVRRRRQRPAARRRHDGGADRRACTGRRWPRGRRPGARPGSSRSRSRWTACPAVRAISGGASRATFAAWGGLRRRRWRRRRRSDRCQRQVDSG